MSRVGVLLNAATHKLCFPKYDSTKARCHGFTVVSNSSGKYVLQKMRRYGRFILHGGSRSAVVLQNGAKPGYSILATLHGACQAPGKPLTCSNPLGELCQLRLDDPLDDYIDKFYQRLTRCDILSKP
jgi:hypothetical protein